MRIDIAQTQRKERSGDMESLNIFCHTGKPPTVSNLSRRYGDGTFGYLSYVGPAAYSCRIITILNGDKVLNRDLPNGSLGTYLHTLLSYKNAGVHIRGIFLPERRVDGLHRAIRRMDGMEKCIVIQKVDF